MAENLLTELRGEGLNRNSLLHIIDCSKNYIASLEGLPLSSSITILNVAENRLRSLKGIERLSKLQTLHAGVSSAGNKCANVTDRFVKMCLDCTSFVKASVGLLSHKSCNIILGCSIWGISVRVSIFREMLWRILTPLGGGIFRTLKSCRFF